MPDARPILITVFEPFGGATLNASFLVGNALTADEPNVELLRLPVVAGLAEAILCKRLDADPPPRLIVSLGEAGGQNSVRLEHVAINYDHFRIPDNDENQPRDQTINPYGPAAYFATVPAARIVESLNGRTPTPVVLSLSAGAFVCNQVAYRALEYLADGKLCPYLFVHVPAWRERGDLILEDIVETVRAVVGEADRLAPRVDTPRHGNV